jgi:hypothetical protein
MRALFVEKMKFLRQTPDWEQESRRYAAHYTWKKAADSYLDYYAEILR